MRKRLAAIILLMLLIALGSLQAASKLQNAVSAVGGQIVYRQTPGFNSYFPVGLLSVSATAPRPSGECELENENQPGTGGASCWVSTVGFSGVSKDLRIGESYEFSPYLEVIYDSTEGSLPYDWRNTFSLKFRDGFLNYTFSKDNPKLVRINSIFNLKVSLDNKLSPINGGFSTTKRTDVLYSETKSVIPQFFLKNVNDYNIPADTSILGQSCIEVLSYVEVGFAKHKIYPSDSQNFCYNVVPNIAEFINTSTKCSASSECRIGFSCQKALDSSDVMLCMKAEPSIINNGKEVFDFRTSWPKIVIALLIFGVLGGISYFVFRGGKNVGKK